MRDAALEGLRWLWSFLCSEGECKDSGVSCSMSGSCCQTCMAGGCSGGLAASGWCLRLALRLKRLNGLLGSGAGGESGSVDADFHTDTDSARACCHLRHCFRAKDGSSERRHTLQHPRLWVTEGCLVAAHQLLGPHFGEGKHAATSVLDGDSRNLVLALP